MRISDWSSDVCSSDLVDAFAVRSQQHASAARADGRYAKSLIPVRDLNGRVVLDHDEYIRPDTTVDSLGQLKPSLAQMGQMGRSEEHTSELQSLMRTSYAVFCLITKRTVAF